MKVTNLETSKKLKELGFEAETMAFIDPDSEECQIWLNAPEGLIPAYDLETILEALPKRIRGNRGVLGDGYLKIDYYKKQFRYDDAWGGIATITRANGEWYLVGCNMKENETQANTAARLLIKLVEDNIIKLGE